MPENCAAIVIAAKHHELTKVKDTRGTTHTVGALRCKFDFRTNDWSNAAKTAMFCNGNALLHPEVTKDAISVPLDSDNECSVPYEVLTDTLPYSVGVWGVTDKGFRIVSRWLVFEAQDGCYTEGNAPADPEPTIYEQILATAQQAVSAAEAVTERANSGEFIGESAYQIAVQQGYEGTEAEWIESLVGDDGLGIIKSEINASGELVITYSDGSFVNLGVVVGGGGGNYIDIDNVLSATSTNPVQNKVITAELETVDERISEVADHMATAHKIAIQSQETANAAGAVASYVKDTLYYDIQPRLTALEGVDHDAAHEATLNDAKAYADSLAVNYATKEQGDIADDMSAVEVTDEVVKRIESGEYDVIVLNFAFAYTHAVSASTASSVSSFLCPIFSTIRAIFSSWETVFCFAVIRLIFFASRASLFR